MQYDQKIHPLLICRRLPGRVDVTDAAALLGFKEHDIAVLIAAKLLKPLGKPVPNAPKYFSAKRIVELAEDEDWLDRATKRMSEHWRARNEGSRVKSVQPDATGESLETTKSY